MSKINSFLKKTIVSKSMPPRTDYGRQVARQLMLQYTFAIILFPAICFVLFLLGTNLYYYYRRLTGDNSSVIFWLAQIIRETLPIVAALVGIVGWLLITWHFLCKPLRQLDEIVAAAEALATPTDTPIRLSAEMKNVQDNLNLVREQALRNALLAREAEQRKNDLVVYLAHDLKTPLTSVIGYLTLLQEEPDLSPEFRARYTGIALDKALRLEDLINEFFDITRFNLTALTLEKERIHLSRMLEQITSEFLPILAEKNLTWHTDIAPGIELLCDPDKLERVFDNLIRNAVNYSYPSTEISLCMKPSDTTRSVIITISNHGKTIPPDKLARIFEQFFRLDSSRSSATGGAGLGLAISKEIVEQHGGSITAASEQESVTFTVTLPL